MNITSKTMSTPSVRQTVTNGLAKTGKGLLIAGTILMGAVAADMFTTSGRTGNKLEYDESKHVLKSVPVSYFERVQDEISGNVLAYPHITAIGKAHDTYQDIKKDVNVLTNKGKEDLTIEKQGELLKSTINYPNSFVGKIAEEVK